MRSDYYNGYPTASEIHQDEVAFSKWLSAAADESNAGRSYALELMRKVNRVQNFNESKTKIGKSFEIFFSNIIKSIT